MIDCWRKFLWITCIPICCFHETTIAESVVTFDLEFVGAVFEPYTKYYEDETHNSDYTMQDVENMLNLTATKFHRISSYGMGTIAHKNWTEGLPGGYSAFAAATINKKLGKMSLVINIGAWPLGDGLYPEEIKNAFAVAYKSNKVYNGTASGIIIANHYADWDHTLALLVKHSKKAKENNLKLGIRTWNCQGLIQTAQGDNDLTITVQNLTKRLDFIICHKLPSFDGEIQSEAEKITQFFLQMKIDFQKINKKIEVIGETGWHSLDPATSQVISTSIQNLKQFWSHITNFATREKFKVDMFTSFDEPWKKSLGSHEAHWGWWKRIRNDTSTFDAFVEKIHYKPTYELKNKNSHTKISNWVMGLAIFGGIVTLAIFGSGVFLYVKLRQNERGLLSKAEIEQFENGIQRASDDETIEDALLLPYDKKFEIPKSKFKIDRSRLLGSGASGLVYKGYLEGYYGEVAFKVTKSDCSATSLKSLLSEIKIMIRVGKHPNVVSILGAYTKEISEGSTMIAVELCKIGLEDYLRENKMQAYPINTTLSNPYLNTFKNCGRYINVHAELSGQITPNRNSNSWRKDLIKWAYEIACGMEHIASKKIIHSDLATRNVMLDFDHTAKITDFGLSRHLYEYTNYVKSNQEPLPWKWLALESLKTMTFSTKSDVWAYGVTLWEIFSFGDTPYPGLAWSVNFPDELEKGLRMNCPKFATSEIYDVMLECWSILPKDRPDFKSLSLIFHDLLNEVTNDEYTVI